jgi:hypothetical protein
MGLMANTALPRRIKVLTSSSRQKQSTPKRLAWFAASVLGLGLAVLATGSCGAPQPLPSPARGGEGSAAETAKPNPSWDLKAGRIVVSGAIAPDAIRAVLRNELGRFRDCYDRLPQPRPVVVSTLRFTIGAAGQVTAGRVDSEQSPALGACLERVVLAMQFPSPTDGDVTVDYPMQFGP